MCSVVQLTKNCNGFSNSRLLLISKLEKVYLTSYSWTNDANCRKEYEAEIFFSHWVIIQENYKFIYFSYKRISSISSLSFSYFFYKKKKKWKRLTRITYGTKSRMLNWKREIKKDHMFEKRWTVAPKHMILLLILLFFYINKYFLNYPLSIIFDVPFQSSLYLFARFLLFLTLQFLHLFLQQRCQISSVNPS